MRRYIQINTKCCVDTLVGLIIVILQFSKNILNIFCNFMYYFTRGSAQNTLMGKSLKMSMGHMMGITKDSKQLTKKLRSMAIKVIMESRSPTEVHHIIILTMLPILIMIIKIFTIIMTILNRITSIIITLIKQITIRITITTLPLTAIQSKAQFTKCLNLW